jgi:transcription elongation factor Elf1
MVLELIGFIVLIGSVVLVVGAHNSRAIWVCDEHDEPLEYTITPEELKESDEHDYLSCGICGEKMEFRNQSTVDRMHELVRDGFEWASDRGYHPEE